MTSTFRGAAAKAAARCPEVIVAFSEGERSPVALTSTLVAVIYSAPPRPATVM